MFLKTRAIPLDSGVEIHQFESLKFRVDVGDLAQRLTCFARAVGRNGRSINLCTRDLSAVRDIVPGFGDGRVDHENAVAVGAATLQWLRPDLLGATSLRDGFTYVWRTDEKRMLEQLARSTSTDIPTAKDKTIRCDSDNCLLVDILFSERLGSGEVTALWVGRSAEQVVALRAIVDDEEFIEIRDASSMVVHDGNFTANPAFLTATDDRFLFGTMNVWRTGVPNGSRIDWHERRAYSSRASAAPFAWRPIVAVSARRPSGEKFLVLNDQNDVLAIDTTTAKVEPAGRLRSGTATSSSATPVRAIGTAAAGRALLTLRDAAGADRIMLLRPVADGTGLAAVDVGGDGSLAGLLARRCVIDMTSTASRLGVLLGPCSRDGRSDVADDAVVCEFQSDGEQDRADRCRRIPLSVHGAADARRISLARFKGSDIAAFGFRDGHIEVTVADAPVSEPTWHARGWIPAHVGAVIGLAFVADHDGDYLRTAGSDGAVLQFSVKELAGLGLGQGLPMVPVPVILYRSSRPLRRLWQIGSNTYLASEDAALIRIPNQNDLLQLACSIVNRDMGADLAWRNQRRSTFGSERRDAIQRYVDAACDPHQAGAETPPPSDHPLVQD
jgi:hypothetical protein